MRYADLFLWDPAYTMIFKKLFTHSGAKEIDNADDRLSVVMLYKDISNAYPTNPYS